MKKLLIILGLAVAHFTVHLATFFASFGATLDRFDTARPATAAEQMVDAAVSILQFPLVTLALALPRPIKEWFGGPAGYVPVVLNSLVWASCIYLVAGLLMRLGRRE